MQKYHLQRSMSRKSCSPDNAACEGFFGRMKNEYFYGRNFRGYSINEFRKYLDGYIIWYNESRIKMSLGNRCPVEYRLRMRLCRCMRCLANKMSAPPTRGLQQQLYKIISEFSLGTSMRKTGAINQYYLFDSISFLPFHCADQFEVIHLQSGYQPIFQSDAFCIVEFSCWGKSGKCKNVVG